MRKSANTVDVKGCGWLDGGVGLGQTIKQWRERAGYTQTDLAIKAGVSLSTIQKMEASAAVGGRRSTVRQVIEAMGFTLEDLDAIQVRPDTVAVHLPRDVYNSILERSRHEGHPTVADMRL
jgi:predicted transcriptional regulator